MSPYYLNCSVCESNFSRSDDWTKHLFGSYHQNKARLKCAQWQRIHKECALVVFFSQPISPLYLADGQVNGECDKEEHRLIVLLRYYLTSLIEDESFCGPLLISDFIWWNEQPKMCILQLESRAIVDNVYPKLVQNDKGVQKLHKLGSYFVQFKKLVDMLELEWRMLIPDADSKSQKRSCAVLEGVSSPHPKKVKANGYQASEQDIVPTENNHLSSDNSNLTTQYNNIIKSVQIPEQLYSQAVQLTEKIKTVLCYKYGPKCEAYLLRSHCLPFKNRLYNEQNDILIFVHGGPNPAIKDAPKSFIRLKIDPLTKTLLTYKQFPGLSISTAKPITTELDLDHKTGQRFELPNNNSHTSGFHLFTDLYFGIEAQLGQLLKYMCKFDLRCYPVISLMHYFCTLNSCYFDDPNWQGDTMEWLVILFMSNKKYIPTVRNILNQSHSPIWQMSEKRKIDIGFNDNDQQFLDEWNKSTSSKNLNLESNSDQDGAFSVLKLFQEFLSFFANTFEYKNVLLNIRDGEIHNRKLMFNKMRRKADFTTELSGEEMGAIISSPCHLAKWGKWPFSIVHPLVVNSKLGYQTENLCVAVKLMKWGATQLEKYLEDMGKNGDLDDIFKIDNLTKKSILNRRLSWQRLT